ncbi:MULTISPECIES: Fic family protein [Listeriaceae]|uniref:Fic family protein n=1 Tax=Listeria TaxID=1637 RepID=UPI000669F946|nr:MULTISPECIES: Fic family protein [Listeria]KMT60699.1 hypothetical protein X559_2404 [Listeria newyorkensis]WAO22996.1 Fic family protein [Listeria newyorkensis]SQC57145.1 Protein involved in cell division [Listeria newyorkensis]
MPISIALVKEIHANLADKLQYDRGEFKTGENAILGADFQTASPTETPILMQQWVYNLNYRLEQDSLDEKLRAVAESHIDFERVHPFSDGNGRTGRMLMNYALLENDFPPLIIRVDERAQYIQYLATQDSEAFFRFVKDKLEEEKERAKRFQNSEDQKIPRNKNRNAD